MNYFAAYTFYLAKVATMVVAILIVLSGIVAISSKGKQKDTKKVKIKKINNHFEDLKNDIDNATLSKKALKAAKKSQKKSKQSKAEKAAIKPRLFIIDFDGDLNANATSSLRDIVTAIILVAAEKDEVLLRLQSPGGLVNSYGLASSQLQRLRCANINLTASVDKMAASGGYMMACVANRIIAAPFAIIGSIGVVAQLPNFHRYLEQKDIDFEQITAGQYKRTLTVFGENTDEGREKFKQELEDTHLLFQQHITQFRPQLDMDQIATGEHWYGTKALELNLIDSIQTSDDHILQAKQEFDLFVLSITAKKTLLQRLLHPPQSWLTALIQNTKRGGQDYLA